MLLVEQHVVGYLRWNSFICLLSNASLFCSFDSSSEILSTTQITVVLNANCTVHAIKQSKIAATDVFYWSQLLKNNPS